jgi:hypothetical protein
MVIIIIIIIIDETATAFLRRFCRICTIRFSLFWICNSNSLQDIAVSLVSSPLPAGPGLCIYVSSDKVPPARCPQAPGPLSSPSGTQGYGGGILTRLHMGSSEQIDNNNNNNSVALVRERTIQTELPPLIGEVSANVCGYKMSRGKRDGSLRPYSRFSRPEF